MSKSIINNEVIAQASKIKLLLMDCDGVLTDGRLYYSERGEEMKVFHVRDGQGIVLWHQAGFRSGIITGRNSKIVELRANELGMHYVKLNSVIKEKDFEDILQNSNVKAEEVAYIGDDIADIPVMQRVGFAITIADGVLELDQYTKYKTRQFGGLGAVREAIDLLINSKKN